MKIKSISNFDGQAYAENHANPNSFFNQSLKNIEASQPQWVQFEGVDVLRIGNSRYVAVPSSSRKNSASFDIIDVQSRTLVTQVLKSEVNGWLYGASHV